MRSQPQFLPLTPAEGRECGIDRFDIVLVTGDAYVDHPSFGTALIGRVLWDAGFSVGIIAQPDIKTQKDFTALGTPRLFFGISSGNVDSMVNNFTPNLKRRSADVYSPGGALRRPDRATIVYTQQIHAAFPGVPIVLGGIEASLRRFAHYDYWQDRVRQSILADAPATLLAYGMAEQQMVAIAQRLDAGEPARSIRDIPGTCYTMEVAEWRARRPDDIVEVPSFSEVSSDKTAYARAFALHYREQDPVRGRPVAQTHPKTVVVQNPPARPLPAAELDRIYELPFSRRAHPSYKKSVPALEPVQFSVVSHRGCFGSCSFCALTHHQGRIVQSRSAESLVREVTRMATMPEFKGVVQDVGGPTANMYGMGCDRWDVAGSCPDKSCSPACPTLRTSHRQLVDLLRKISSVPGVKKVFVGSGIRYDLVLADDPGSRYLEELCEHHVSGHLKVAPEHVSPRVTMAMNKPDGAVFDRFVDRFESLQKGKGKRQYLVPYFMSGHPGCTVNDMVALAEYIRDRGLYTEQVQDFTPTPMSVSTCMYYTGLNPFTLEPVHVPKGREKKIQRALLQYREPQNRGLVLEGLRTAGREDLIGTGKKCLVAGEKCGDRYRPGPAARGKRTRRQDPGHDPGSTSKKVPEGE
ncbi:YgiQ family radical SAM protein [Methanoregula sp.]|uniref:YgiQ family radical SAM protein n=1 Tax=Methanoregula sp. TaxID=2052170 RepID=UPI002CFAE962|nr:YgiQ family radical SAM protein [Methanoregula sp.]HVP95676.1 YgiQ family radical SAM protein [Methanoregula sp.]